MKAKHKTSAVCLLLALLLLSAPSCSKNPPDAQNEGETQTSSETQPAEAETEAVYPGAVLNLGDRDIRIFNIDEYWGMTVELNPDEATGDRLNDTIYERAAKIEDMYHCKIVNDRYAAELMLGNMAAQASRILTAGDDSYDVMYIPDTKITTLASDGVLYNLHDLPELLLDSAWWDSSYNELASINGKLFGACGDGYLMPYDSSWCLFFNEVMLSNLGLELPYSIVKEGKWTFDALHSYLKATANLNGEPDWKWQTTGSAVYGLVTHEHAPDKFILGAGITYVEKNGDEYSFSAENERFYDVAVSLSEILGEEGTTLPGNCNDFDPDRGYVYTFMNNRAAFMTAELKTAMNMRDMENNFGIVPFPKYDEAQESYYTSIMNDMLVFTIPSTSKHPHDTAAVMDAFYYEGMQSVVPVYFDVTVSHKGLRNENSIEMLNIIRENRLIDISTLYGWNSQLVNQIRISSFDGNINPASEVAKFKTMIIKQMNKFIEEIKS